MNVGDATSRIRRDAYTGENRCTPCTVLNLCIAGGLSAVATVAGSPLLGGVVFAVGTLAIYARGYLVPGTPTMTERYLPASLQRRLGKEPVADDAVSPPAADDRGLAPLVDAGVLSRDGDEAVLTAAFGTDWRERTAAVVERGVDPTDVRTLFDAESVSRHGDLSFVVDGTSSVRWGSEAALAADVVAAAMLRDRHPAWESADVDRRRSVLRGLRLCLETCPACGGAVAADERRVDPCCNRPHLVAESVCVDCGAVLGDAAVVAEGAESVRRELL